MSPVLVTYLCWSSLLKFGKRFRSSPISAPEYNLLTPDAIALNGWYAYCWDMSRRRDSPSFSTFESLYSPNSSLLSTNFTVVSFPIIFTEMNTESLQYWRDGVCLSYISSTISNRCASSYFLLKYVQTTTWSPVTNDEEWLTNNCKVFRRRQTFKDQHVQSHSVYLCIWKW